MLISWQTANLATPSQDYGTTAMIVSLADGTVQTPPDTDGAAFSPDGSYAFYDRRQGDNDYEFVVRDLRDGWTRSVARMNWSLASATVAWRP